MYTQTAEGHTTLAILLLSLGNASSVENVRLASACRSENFGRQGQASDPRHALVVTHG